MSITIEKLKPIALWGSSPGKPVVILISGRAGVGKTTFAGILNDFLKEKGYAVAIRSFASGVKDIAIKLGWDLVKDNKGRRLLQNVGNAGREYDLDIWIKYLSNNTDLYSFDFVLIDDWRFPNEYEKISENPFLNVYTVKITAPEREILRETLEYNDISETSLDNFKDFSGFIYNGEDMHSLERSAVVFLNSIFGKEVFK